MILTRRKFLLGMAAAVPAAIVVPEIVRSYFLAPRTGWPQGDFLTEDMIFKSVERYSQGWTNPRGVFGSGSILPNKLIVPPHLEAAARRVLYGPEPLPFYAMSHDGRLTQLPEEDAALQRLETELKKLRPSPRSRLALEIDHRGGFNSWYIRTSR
jgi:hypothetical protein